MLEDFPSATWSISFILAKIRTYMYMLPSVWPMGFKCLCHHLYSWSGCVGACPSVCWLQCLAVCVVQVSVLPAPGPARGRPETPSCEYARVPWGRPCPGPERCESGVLLAPARSAACARWGVLADLCSLVLSFQWCADR